MKSRTVSAVIEGLLAGVGAGVIVLAVACAFGFAPLAFGSATSWGLPNYPSLKARGVEGGGPCDPPPWRAFDPCVVAFPGTGLVTVP